MHADDAQILSYVVILSFSRYRAPTNIQIVTGAEVTIGNCFPKGGEILPEAEGRG